MFNIVIYILVGYGVYLLFGCALQRRVVFPRHFTRYDPDDRENFPDLEVWHLETEAGKTAGWFLPARNSKPEVPSPAVIFAYGNADVAADWAPLLAPYRNAGIHVLIPEYRGYGSSDGSPSQRAIVSDFVEFYDRLADYESVDQDNIFFHGRSLGGGVVCALSKERKPTAIVLSSTFTSIGEMARRYFFPASLMKDEFDNKEALSTYEGPVLLLHGREDELTPLSHAHKLKRAAPDAKLVILPGDHNNMAPYIYGGVAWEHIFDFLAERGGITPIENETSNMP